MSLCNTTKYAFNIYLALRIKNPTLDTKSYKKLYYMS